MDTKDIVAVGGALIVVLIIALVVKPMFLGGESVLSHETGSNNQLMVLPSTTILPSTPQTTKEEVSYPPPWDGTVIVLSFAGATGTESSFENSSSKNATALGNNTLIPTPRIFNGQTTVKGTEGVFPDHKLGIPEGAIRIPIMNYSQKNDSTLIFVETYTLSYTTVGLLVDVVKPPFKLQFTTTPTTTDPHYENNPHYCFFTLTVRDPMTKEIVTEEGYGRLYTTNHEKSIIIYRSGEYHLTLYGNMVQVKLSIFAGA